MPTEGKEVMSRKQIEFAKREQEILSAAISLFEDPHWETVTVEQISKKAEIGKGTVYKHFTCKEEIYANISTAFMRRTLDSYGSINDHPEVIDSIKENIGITFDLFINNPAEARVSFYCKRADFRERLTPELRSQFEALDKEFESYFGTILQSGVEKGLFPNKSVEHLMMGLEATFDGAISMIWNGGDLTCQVETEQETYVNIISEYMIAGLVGLAK